MGQEAEYFVRSLNRLPERARDGWVPAALVLAADCNCSGEVKKHLLQRLERLAWFLLLVKADPKAIHERFGRVTQSLRNGGLRARLLILRDPPFVDQRVITIFLTWLCWGMW